MNPIHWKSRKTLIIIFSIFTLYLLIRIRNNEHKTVIVLPKVHPNEVYEFVADFSNMKYLNPTINDFVILDESGNYDHWRYTVKYSETSHVWPYLSNIATANFDVKPNSKKDTYHIHSVHNTCLFYNLFCLESHSEFKFTHNDNKSLPSANGNGAICEETITYQCPVFLSLFCRKEVTEQRNAIMNNLRIKFAGSSD